ncbi:hypothetical protein MTYP_02111 [Methylophilaceae bacterium]|nr:hypothetical protein MTYP_02111 [Methylophilaceae bacterium]
MNNDEKSKDPSSSTEAITSRKLSITENIATKLGDLIDPRRTVPLDKRLAKLTPEQKEQLQTIEDKAITNFVGMIDELESALGMLRIGYHVGWKVIYMVHSKKTVRKYEEILDIKVREIFPERGPSADRSVGLALADKFSNFWKVVSGEIKIDHRREII